MLHRRRTRNSKGIKIDYTAETDKKLIQNLSGGLGHSTMWTTLYNVSGMAFGTNEEEKYLQKELLDPKNYALYAPIETIGALTGIEKEQNVKLQAFLPPFLRNDYRLSQLTESIKKSKGMTKGKK